MSSTDIPETALAEAWRYLRLDAPLSPATPRMQVIFPGKPNQDAGPDFLRAMVVNPAGQVVTGDAEVDLRPGLWRQHRHHRNPLYRDVSFQVVLDSSRGMPAEPGRPTVIAINPRPPAGSAAPPAPCPAAGSSQPEAVARLIGWAGELRFRSRAGAFTRAMARSSPGQALYQGLMESLGYSHNKVPFRRLAALLPLRRLNVLPGRPSTFPALLLGSAGLLPSQVPGPAMSLPEAALDGEITQMEKEWLDWGRPALLGRPQWRFFKVRPANTPPRRLAAAAYLLGASWLPDPADRLMALLEAPAALDQSLEAPARGYWKDHMDFGVPAPGAASLLGGGRRADMIINIILPFFHAWASLKGWRRLRSLAADLYSAWTGGGDNVPLQFMRARLAGIAFEDRARQQQGLLHIYHRYCRNGQCRLCPLLRGGRIKDSRQ